MDFPIEPKNQFAFAKYPYGGDMGKIHYKNFVLMICSMCNVKSYLELGVAGGDTFSLLSKHIDDSVGVDIVDSRTMETEGLFVETSTDEFF